MAKLVTCPKCEGTGTVGIKKPETPSHTKTSKLEYGVNEYLRALGTPTEKKPDKEFITCPSCNGFGFIRG